jgi:DNA-binding transcriptional MerR regulator
VTDELLKIGELAHRSGVSAGTIKHYLREGLLPVPVKTSRNMAYYPADYADRIRVIKRLQTQRFMPLRVIKQLLDAGPEKVQALIELEERLLAHAMAGERERVTRTEAQARYSLPDDVLDRLAQLGVLEPTDEGYSPSDLEVIEAISRFRAKGFDESYGFTVYDTLRYRRALEEVVKEEVDVLTKRLSGVMDPDAVAKLIDDGAQPLHQLISALHSKLLVAELRRHTSAAG